MNYIVDNINNYSKKEINNFKMNIYEFKKEKINNMIDNNSKKRSIVAEIMLSKLLKEINLDYNKIEFIINNNGKPFIKDSNIFVNISHSNNNVAVAISNKEIGIDIEDKNNKNIKYKKINNLEELCKKEAYTKMLGESLLNTIDKKVYLDFINKSNNNYYSYICAKK